MDYELRIHACPVTFRPCTGVICEINAVRRAPTDFLADTDTDVISKQTNEQQPRTI